MPTTMTEVLKVLSKLGGVAITCALVMFVYLHLRGYSDNAAWEISLMTVAVAAASNMFPSPLKFGDVVQSTTITATTTQTPTTTPKE